MAYPSDLVRTKNWGTEVLTDTDLEGQFDLIIDWVMAAMDETTGHSHDATANEGPKIATLASTVSGNTTFSGTLTLSNDPTFTSGNALVPSGAILLWSGAISAIPTGWALCDGTSGTPDLTDRFIIHADADAAGTNNVGDSGGSRTISEANLPAHTHSMTIALFPEAGTDTKVADGAGSTSGNFSGTTGSTGSGTDYLPKYYALAYIMKT